MGYQKIMTEFGFNTEFKPFIITKLFYIGKFIILRAYINIKKN